MTTLYFIRHGETDYNRQGIIQGGGIDSDLNETGIRQAHSFYQNYQHIGFDAVYASPLRRTHQTLHPWKIQGYELRIEEGLKEFDWGSLEGVKPSEAQEKEFSDAIRRWESGETHFRYAGGESPVDAWKRAEAFFSTLTERHPRQKLLLCSHGRQLRVILAALVDRDLRAMHKYGHHNTALTIVHINSDGHAYVEKHNDHSHLHPMKS
ncbi:MAG: histidine phosphatase family protein [Bacteroidetes bacterium]|nr:MAG: histidine phosphatase family protein [Bacteroidota bacterium]